MLLTTHVKRTTLRNANKQLIKLDHQCSSRNASTCLTSVQRRNYTDHVPSSAVRSRVDWRSAASRRVVITGLGMTTPLGVGVTNSWNALLAGQSGVRSLRDRPEFARMPSQVAAWLPESQLNLADHFSAIERRQLSTSCLHALLASDEALKDADYRSSDDPSEQQSTGTLIGAGMCDLQLVADTGAKFERDGYRAVGPQLVSRALINSAAGLVSIRHRFRGPNSATSTACTTGLHAIGDAYQLIRIGRAERMLAGGVDCALNPLVVAAFCRLRALSCSFNDHPTKASRPFDRQRDGFVLGEGCGLLLLETLSSAKARGARIYAEILGCFFSAFKKMYLIFN
jgi:3-oxoacyl-[acyl-carrier-protein] synthase II